MESERQTRKNRINPKLEGSGWTVAPFEAARSLSDYPQCAIEEYETANGPADYALNVDSVLLGIIEATRLTLGPQNVLTQAERHSRGATENPLYFDGCHIPFLYSTNGEVIWFHDVRHQLNRSRTVARFHTPGALREMFDRDFEVPAVGSTRTQTITRDYGLTRSKQTRRSSEASPIAREVC